MILDETDRAIIAVLRTNARTPISSIAREVGLSSAPTSRRIERLERSGVITGYVATIGEAHASAIEAFTEVRLHGDVDTNEVKDFVRALPEVVQFYAISGDPDALVRFRVDNVDHLQRVVNAIRRSGKVAGTKTLIVMSAWDRATEAVTAGGHQQVDAPAPAPAD